MFAIPALTAKRLVTRHSSGFCSRPRCFRRRRIFPAYLRGTGIGPAGIRREDCWETPGQDR